MAESARESESNGGDITSDTSANSTEFTLLLSESEFSAVIFNNVPECYPPDREIECRYKIKSSVEPNSRDWIGLFKVGWQTSREHCTYEWSPLPNIQNGEQERPVANRVIFLQRYLPKADDEFYQFCYVTYAGDVRGMSVPFQIKNKPIQQEELECCEIEDDEGSSIMVVKNKTAILEESLGRALKENAVLKASKKTVLADLQNAHEAVMQLEVGKADLTAAWKESENKLSCVEQLLAQRNLLEEEQSKRRDLESTNNDLKTMQENLNRRVGELMMILEQERAQTLQVEKNKEKLVIERKQYLENMTADHQIIEKLQNDLKGKEDEFSTVKGRLVELKTRARSESAEFAEKMENVNSANGRLQEQLVQITEENNLLKRNMEEESERLTKKVRDTYLELKSKDEELERAREEIANYRCKIEEVEIAKQEILNDASHEAELLGSTIDKLQADLKEKQEHINQLEDVNTQLTQEKGKTTALEEDYESVISVLHDQLEGEKALNQSLCTQSDRNLASLQGQVQMQLNANMELSQQLEGKNTEIRGLCDELDTCKRQLQCAEEKLQMALSQLTAVNAEVKLLKVEKETLQTTLTDTQGASAQASKNSAASMYALQTTHAHLEKNYLKVKKELDELKRKRTIATFQGSISSDDLVLQKNDEINQNGRNPKDCNNTSSKSQKLTPQPDSMEKLQSSSPVLFQPGIEAESRPGDLSGKSDGVLSLPDGRGVDYQSATGSLIDVYGGKDENTASSYNVKSSPYSHSLRDVGHSTSSSSYSTNPQQLTTTQYHYPHTTTKLFSKPFAPSSSGDIQLGMEVLVTRSRGQIGRGVVKYVGPLPGRKDMYIGVELGPGQEGKNDGSLDGQRLFSCKPNRGIFVSFNKVVMCYN